MEDDKGLASLQVLDPVTRQHVEKAAEALQDEFAGIFARETIARYIAESTDLLSGGSINVFVPVLAHRFARERLKALGQAEGIIVKDMPEVLFVCVHNSGRSQMAAGLVKLRSEGRIHVRSAGSDPGEQINPAVVEAMDRARGRHERGVPQATNRRGRPRCGRRDHDGLRRRLPDLHRQEVRGLGARRPGRAGRRHGATDPRRARRSCADADRTTPGTRQLSQPLLARALVAEAIGTFALVFAGCGAIMVDAKSGALGHVGVAITFGLVIMVMIYAVGHLSGAHFNPAVTFSFALTRHFPWRHVALVLGCTAGRSVDRRGHPARLARQHRARRRTFPSGTTSRPFSGRPCSRSF